MNLAAISRQALARAKKARILHAPGMSYYGEHICIFAYDRDGRPMVLTGPDGAVALFSTPLEADDELARLCPGLPVEVDDFATRPPAQILPCRRPASRSGCRQRLKGDCAKLASRGNLRTA